MGSRTTRLAFLKRFGLLFLLERTGGLLYTRDSMFGKTLLALCTPLIPLMCMCCTTSLLMNTHTSGSKEASLNAHVRVLGFDPDAAWSWQLFNLYRLSAHSPLHPNINFQTYPHPYRATPRNASLEE